MSAQPGNLFGSAANDADAQETREWIDALSAVIATEGRERGHFLLEQLLEQARQANLVPPDITLADFARWVEIVKANYRALVGYQVRPYPGPITVFRATGNDPRRVPDQGPDLGWGKVSDRVKVVAVPGDHKSILRKPNVQVLAERLRAALRGQRASACERSRANAAAP